MTLLKSLTDFTTAINQDKPNCLYCGTLCTYTESSIDDNNFQGVESYFCDFCKERFVNFKFTLDNTSLYFTFSCKLITVTVHPDCIIIGKDINCPLVSFDFSDKDKLFNKLKTYMIFS